MIGSKQEVDVRRNNRAAYYAVHISKYFVYFICMHFVYRRHLEYILLMYFVLHCYTMLVTPLES